MWDFLVRAGRFAAMILLEILLRRAGFVFRVVLIVSAFLISRRRPASDRAFAVLNQMEFAGSPLLCRSADPFPGTGVPLIP